MVVFVLIVCNPRILAPSLMPSKDTPSVVAKQSFDSESIVYSLPKLLHIICKHATPHCIESCWGVNGKLFFILNINHFFYKRFLCCIPAPVPLYLSFFAFKAYRTVNITELDE